MALLWYPKVPWLFFSSFTSGVSVSRGDINWAILSFQIPNHRVSSQGHCFPLRKRSRCSRVGTRSTLNSLPYPSDFSSVGILHILRWICQIFFLATRHRPVQTIQLDQAVMADPTSSSYPPQLTNISASLPCSNLLSQVLGTEDSSQCGPCLLLQCSLG